MCTITSCVNSMDSNFRILFLLDFNFFFFKQKTAYEMRISDWSSDVCSSDLSVAQRQVGAAVVEARKRRTGVEADADVRMRGQEAGPPPQQPAMGQRVQGVDAPALAVVDATPRLHDPVDPRDGRRRGTGTTHAPAAHRSAERGVGQADVS